MRKPIIVLAGEDANDRRVMRTLVEAFCPLAVGRVVEINDSVRLRQATGANLDSRAQTIAKKVRARAVLENAEVECVYIHEDLDNTESDDAAAIRRRVQEALDRCRIGARYILAAWEIEAWLLLFPEALSSYRKAWVVPPRFRAKDTGRFADPKRMIRELGSATSRYRESDAPAVIAEAVRLGLHSRPCGRNVSYSLFRDAVAATCADLAREQN